MHTELLARNDEVSAGLSNTQHSKKTRECIKYLKETTNSFGFMNVILLHGNHRHVSATHVAIWRVMETSKQIQRFVEITPQLKKPFD
jgi:hypothetical protein